MGSDRGCGSTAGNSTQAGAMRGSDGVGVGGHAPVSMDFAMISPWASAHTTAAQQDAGAAAAKAEDAKELSYGSRGGVSILGLAMEAGGRHRPRLTSHLKLLASLARKRCDYTGKEPRFFLHCWRQRLAVLLGRFTAHAVAAAAAPTCEQQALRVRSCTAR